MLALLLWSLAQSARCDAALPTARTYVVRLNAAAAETELAARDREGCDVELALIYLQRRQDEKALEHLNKAIEIDSEEIDANYELGKLARVKGELQQAIQAEAMKRGQR